MLLHNFFFSWFFRTRNIQEPVELCKGRDIQWMFLSAQEKPQASTNYVCVLGEAKRYSHSQDARGPEEKVWIWINQRKWRGHRFESKVGKVGNIRAGLIPNFSWCSINYHTLRAERHSRISNNECKS